MYTVISKQNKRSKRIRTTFTQLQLAELEKEFNRDKYLNSNRVKELSMRLSLGTIQIKVWFKNRRRKLKINKDKSNTKINLNECQLAVNYDIDTSSVSPTMNMNNNNNTYNNVYEQIQQKYTSNNDFENLSSCNYFDTNNNDEIKQYDIITDEIQNNNNKYYYEDNKLFNDNRIQNNLNYNNFLNDDWNNYSNNDLNKIDTIKIENSAENNMNYNKAYQFDEPFYYPHINDPTEVQNYFLYGIYDDDHHHCNHNQKYFSSNIPLVE